MSWLTGWYYRKACNISAGAGVGVDYQQIFKVYYASGADGVELLNGEVVYKVHCGRKCNVDFSDIRFSDSDVAYTQKICSKVDGSYAVIAVLVPLDLDFDQTVYCYYGNAVALDVSSDAVFIDSISGVVGAWFMNEPLATDPVVDYSGNGNNGVATGTTVVDGYYAGTKARSFDGASKIEVLHDAVLSAFSEMSIVVLFKPSTTAPQFQQVCGKQSGFAEYRLMIQQFSGNAWLRFNIYSNAAQFESASVAGSILADGTWYHAVGVWDGAQTKIYLNNDLKDSDPAILTMNGNAKDFEIGVNDNINYYFNGVVAGVYLISHGINETEIGNLYSNYPDPSLEAGKVHVRKWATTTLPTLSNWGTEQQYTPPTTIHPKQHITSPPPIPLELAQALYEWLQTETV